ncbi:MAG: DUF2911 domain-containing protein [Flavobacteriaceae bacterium]|nr:DUF2911 domain-containing protein [Flavobacteriaceae bacterium]
MKFILSILIVTMAFTGCKDENSQIQESEHIHEMGEPNAETKNSLSPHTSAMAMIGDAHVHIDYSSPGVRNRIIFGGLLAYDEVWQAGAHMATWIETNKDLIIDGKTLPAGKYGLFAIPSRAKWTLIFNTNWNQHGKDEYNPEEDVLRVTVETEFIDEITEHLKYAVEETGEDEGVISLEWEKVKVELPFEVKN